MGFFLIIFSTSCFSFVFPLFLLISARLCLFLMAPKRVPGTPFGKEARRVADRDAAVAAWAAICARREEGSAEPSDPPNLTEFHSRFCVSPSKTPSPTSIPIPHHLQKWVVGLQTLRNAVQAQEDGKVVNHRG